MTAKTYISLSAIIFALVAVLQLLRAIMQWDVMVNGHHLPIWASLAAAIVAGLLSFAGFRVLQQIQRYLS